MGKMDQSVIKQPSRCSQGLRLTGAHTHAEIQEQESWAHEC